MPPPRRPATLALCVIALTAACGSDRTAAVSAPTSSRPSTSTPAVPTASSPSPMLPSVGPSPTITVPEGTPDAYDEDVPATEIPVDELVPTGTAVTGSWPAPTSAGDAIVVAFEDRTADPFAAARGFVVWRRDEGADPPWRPAFGVMSRARDGVLAVQGSIDDITGDDSPDALMVERTGGVGNCGRWWVIDLSAADPIWRRSMCDAEVVAHRDPTGLEITATVYEPGDPHCCPSSIRTTVYAYRPPDGFVKVSEETTEL